MLCGIFMQKWKEVRPAYLAQIGEKTFQWGEPLL